MEERGILKFFIKGKHVAGDLVFLSFFASQLHKIVSIRGREVGGWGKRGMREKRGWVQRKKV